MAIFSVADLTTPISRADVQASIYKVFAKVGIDTTSWKSGAVVRTLTVGVSIVLAVLSSLQAQIAKSGFLEFSEGDWLELVAFYVYGITKQHATFASGSVTLVNSGGGVYSLSADDLIFVNQSTGPAAGKVYRNSGSVTLGAMSTITIPIVAVEAGTASNANPNDISALSTTLLGVTCFNANSLVALDDESDPTLRVRCYEQLGALSPMGPWDAYASALRNAVHADGSPLGVTRIRINKAGDGYVYTYAATATGGLTGTVGDLTSDLGIGDEAIQQFAVPLAVTAINAGATNTSIAVTYEVWMYNTSGKTPAEIEAAIATRLTAFMSTQPIGGNIIGGAAGKVFQDAIRTTIQATFQEIFHCVVTAPASDVTLSLSQVPVLGTVTVTNVNQSAPPEGFSP